VIELIWQINSMSYPKNYPSIYEELYDLQSKALKIYSFLETLNLSNRNILDIGSGTGYIGNYLAERGFNVTGLEPDLNMYTFSMQKYSDNNSLTFFNCDALNGPDMQSYGAIISTFNVFNYFKTLNYLELVVSRISNSLIVGGSLIIETWNDESILNDPPQEKVMLIPTVNFGLVKLQHSVIYLEDLNFVMKTDITIDAENKSADRSYTFLSELKVFKRLLFLDIFKRNALVLQEEGNQNDWVLQGKKTSWNLVQHFRRVQ
jgi:SAM-dependent methyltransferase